LFEFGTEGVDQSRTDIRLGGQPVAQSLLQKIDLVPEPSAAPAITKFARTCLKGEERITAAMKTGAAHPIPFDERRSQTAASR
jgi:hypothetical protein